MVYSLLATIVVACHLVFILFVLFGALLVWKWPKLLFLHLPSALWGVVVEVCDRACPLTPLENWCRARAGETGYAEGFLEHYILAVVYPAGLTRGVQISLGVIALAMNLGLYIALFRRGRKVESPGGL